MEERHSSRRSIRRREILFLGAVFLSFVAVLLYNILTPYLSDDLLYRDIVRSGDGFWDIFRQEYEQYQTWTGRSVCHLILRLFLLGPKWVFDLCNSLAFVGLLLLMYDFIERKKKQDVYVFGLCFLLVWLTGVDFGQTVLWVSGACNYLWGTLIILGHAALYRRRLVSYAGEGTDRHGFAAAVVLFLTGLIAGWCNENTSGGCLLLLLSFLLPFLQDPKTKKLPKKAWMFTAPAGTLTGLLFMLMAPGNAIRSAVKEEESRGILDLAARFLKIVLAMKEEFFFSFLLLIVLLCLLRAQRAGKEKLSNALRFCLVSLATSFALILAPETMSRAHFGAGIFLDIAIVQCFTQLEEKDAVIQAAKRAFAWILCLVMLFTYVEEGANLMRIRREVDERDAYLWEQREEGKMDLSAPMLRPEWQTPYSYAYGSDIHEDPQYWINQAFAQHYLLFSLRGVPRQEWDGYGDG